MAGFTNPSHVDKSKPWLLGSIFHFCLWFSGKSNHLTAKMRFFLLSFQRQPRNLSDASRLATRVRGLVLRSSAQRSALDMRRTERSFNRRWVAGAADGLDVLPGAASQVLVFLLLFFWADPQSGFRLSEENTNIFHGFPSKHAHPKRVGGGNLKTKISRPRSGVLDFGAHGSHGSGRAFLTALRPGVVEIWVEQAGRVPLQGLLKEKNSSGQNYHRPF